MKTQTSKKRSRARKAAASKAPRRRKAPSRKKPIAPAPAPPPNVPALWARARDEIVAAFMSDALRTNLNPLGDSSPTTLRKIEHSASELHAFLTQAITGDIPRAQAIYEASHPPCAATPICPHLALIDVAADRWHQQGHPNPTVAFRQLSRIVREYLKNRS